MTRFVPVTVLVVVLAVSRLASAQADPDTTMLPGGATIVFEHLQIFHDGAFRETEANSTERLRYFNLAHCNCAKLKQGLETDFKYIVRETMLSQVHEPVDFWVGTQCATDANRTGPSATCKIPVSIRDIDASLYPGGSTQAFNLYDVVNGLNEGACTQLEGNSTIWAFVSTTGTVNVYDYKTSQNIGSVYGEMSDNGVDTRPPPLPTAIKAAPGENAINLTWTPPTANNTDVYYYQALCANVDDSPARTQEQGPDYVTTASLCTPDATSKDPDLVATTIAPGDGDVAVGAPTGPFSELDPTFICGHTDTGTASSLTIGGLENGTHYKVILVSVDLHGNYSGTFLTSTVTPHLVTDFWEDLHDHGSKTEGGLCLLAETYGDNSSLTQALRAFRDDTLGGSQPGRWLTDAYYATLATLGSYVHGSIALRIVAGIMLAPAVAVALAWYWLTLPGLLAVVALVWLWRRRHSMSRWLARVTAPAAVVILLVLPARAHAGGYQPYWEDSTIDQDQNQAAPSDPSLVRWHVGVRVGPYTPDIDTQFMGTGPGPYAQMFGGSRILPMLDVDRVLWSGFGQVSVGLSLGYMQKTAHAFARPKEGTPPPTIPVREPGATTRFHLIPFELAASYRFSWLDDEYGIPIVPYVRGGIAYYGWWVNAPDGSYASVCEDAALNTNGIMAPGCSQNKAYGASLGVQGSIGLSIRAERIDASTANSMRQSGIQHAGIYGELSFAKVDGFGSATKLSVGDRTWFAGVDFEF